MKRIIGVLLLMSSTVIADGGTMWEAGQPRVSVAKTITLHIHGHEFILTPEEAMSIRNDLLKWSPYDCGGR
jgi:hypothetical protein